MSRPKTIPLLLSLGFSAGLLWAGNALAPPEQERIARLENMVLAPCCYAEPVSRHSSEIALKMRAEITAWVSEGKTDREILDTYKQLYGLRVLAEPEGASWWWATLVPWAIFALASIVTVLILRSWRHAAPAPVSQGG